MSGKEGTVKLINIDLSEEECNEVISMYEDITRLSYDEVLERHKEIGYGHYSEVYLMDNQKYVLKIFVEYNFINDVEVMQCGDPFILQDLQHLNVRGQRIVPAIHAFVPGEFVVMDYIEGIEIEYQRNNNSFMSEDFWDRFFEGVIAIYKAGYMQNDLHSENLMINKEGHPVFIDVGGYFKHHDNKNIKMKLPAVLVERNFEHLQQAFVDYHKEHLPEVALAI